MTVSGNMGRLSGEPVSQSDDLSAPIGSTTRRTHSWKLAKYLSGRHIVQLTCLLLIALSGCLNLSQAKTNLASRHRQSEAPWNASFNASSRQRAGGKHGDWQQVSHEIHSSQSNRLESSSSQLAFKSSKSSRTNALRVNSAMANLRPNRQASANVQRLRRQQSLAPQTSAMRADNTTRKCALILQRTYVTSDKLASGRVGELDNDDGSNEANVNQPPADNQERICITYEAVDRAIDYAKQRRRFKRAPDAELASIEPKVTTISDLGELNQAVTLSLTQTYDLSPDEILNGLPMIDMSRTKFWPLCPLMVKPIKCDPTARFRSFTGHCNNLRQPAWGAAQTPFVRFLPPRHPDGVQAERVSVLDGSRLPSARLVTSLVHQDHDLPSGDLSLLIMSWGQIIDHDVAQAAPPRDERGMDFNCCNRQHPNCMPIEIPENDPFYGRHNQRCMDFKRSLAGLRPQCALGPRVHINTITATLDANTVYGSTKAMADELRTFVGGRLKSQNVFPEHGLKDLLPKQLQQPDLDCFARPPGMHCFLAGDDRVNEQPTLTVMHTLYMREHNRLADKLAAINTHWDDDRIYHETRHIVAAVVQHLVVSEYLPLLLGQDMMVAYNLTESPPGTYWRGYDPNVTPSIAQGFTTAAFRQGHTFIQGKVRLHDSKTHDFLGFEMLHDLFKRPFHYYRPAKLDQVLAGVINTPAQVYDPFITEEISGRLFQMPGLNYGMDLPAINLARGREQGTPGYNIYREWCGLPRVETFEDLQPIMSNMTAYLYSRLYKHVDDIDLWSGGVSERPMTGGQIGPTFACIIARQFSNIKRGDRFWFENANQPSSFTLDQLREIKRSTQAGFMCRNSDNLKMIQRRALRLSHPVFNPRVRCADIPDLNLELWREDPSNLGSFFTFEDNET